MILQNAPLLRCPLCSSTGGGGGIGMHGRKLGKGGIVVVELDGNVLCTGIEPGIGGIALEGYGPAFGAKGGIVWRFGTSIKAGSMWEVVALLEADDEMGDCVVTVVAVVVDVTVIVTGNEAVVVDGVALVEIVIAVVGSVDVVVDTVTGNEVEETEAVVVGIGSISIIGLVGPLSWPTLETGRYMNPES